MSWPFLELQQLCSKIGSGATPRGGMKSYKAVGVTLVRSMNIQLGRFKRDNLVFLDDAQASKLDNVALERDDVLLNITGASVARCSLLENSLLPARVNQHVCILRANQKKLLPEFLMRYLTSEETQMRLLKIAGAGATREAITKSDIEKFLIPLPPLAEQKKIAAILDAADQLRQKDQQLIDHYTALSQSLFLEMFGDPVSNPKGWDLAQISTLSNIVRGSSPRPKGDPRYYGGKVPRLMVADLTRDGKMVTPRIDTLTEEGKKKSRPIKQGTVVMAVSGNVGLTSILAVDACIHDGFIAFNDLKSDLLYPQFFVDLMMFMKSTHAGREAGAIFKNLTTTQIKDMSIPLPPMERQMDYQEKTKKVQQQIDVAKINGRKSEELFSSLLQRAFKGELTSSKAA